MDRERIIRTLRKCNLQPDGETRKYTIADKLGQGGNGVTFLVRVASQELVAKIYVPPDNRDLDTDAFIRFKREIELSSRTRHPFVVPVRGTGNIAVTTHTFPFYLMPKAKATLRKLIPPTFTFEGLSKRLRVFTQILSGVCYLHHIGIFHRDLKPENVLLFANDVPMVADLGIAHVAPNFIEWSKLTLPKDKLMNWYYYAPEQRSGDATKVDHRADIYALGLILYELVSGISPSRPNLPDLASFDDRLACLDNIFRKMTAYDPKKRYQNLDLVLDDLTWALVAAGIPATAPSTEEIDKKNLIRLLKSQNAANQAQAHDIVQRLGEKVLPELHEMTGNQRLDVSLAAYRLLGTIAHKDSLPYLLAGLYPRRSSQKPRFITGETAAEALKNYPIGDRIKTLKTTKDLVLANHVARIVEDISPEDAYPIVLKLFESNLFFEDWGQETGISLLLHLNQDKAWQLVEKMLTTQKIIYSSIILRDFFPNVKQERQMALIDYLFLHDSDLNSWDLPKIYNTVLANPFSKEFKLSSFSQLKEIANRRIKNWDERQAFVKKVNESIDFL